MAKSIRDIPKKRRGRPATGGRRDGILVRLGPEQFAILDAWIRHNDPGLSRPEAVRRLVEIGLKAKGKPKQPRTERAARARELAAKAIEKMSDPSVSPEERTQRRRRLTRGPLEFRDERLDLPQTKRNK
jgi:hypothetical protein